MESGLGAVAKKNKKSCKEADLGPDQRLTGRRNQMWRVTIPEKAFREAEYHVATHQQKERNKNRRLKTNEFRKKTAQKTNEEEGGGGEE